MQPLPLTHHPFWALLIAGDGGALGSCWFEVPSSIAGVFGLLPFTGPCHEVVVCRRDGLGAARAPGGLREGLPGGDAGGRPAWHNQRRLQSHRQPQH